MPEANPGLKQEVWAFELERRPEGSFTPGSWAAASGNGGGHEEDQALSWLDKAEKRLRPYAIPNLTVYLIAGQVICWALSLSRPEILYALRLVPARVFAGEVWRLVTFVFDPPLRNAFFAFFAWYIFYLMGDALEHRWGAARYNIFLAIAYVATLLASLLTPWAAATNAYIGGSVFLAFAYLFPDFEFYLFFLLPIKVKWLALLTWIGYFLSFVRGPWSVRFVVLAAVSNFLLFFGRDIWLTMRSRRRRMARHAEQIREQGETVHCCAVCGVTDKSDPEMDFRYCSKCADSPCYCRDHIRDHRHQA